MTKTTGDVIRPVSLRTSWWNHMNGQLRKAKKYAERSHWVLLQVSLVRRLSVSVCIEMSWVLSWENECIKKGVHHLRVMLLYNKSISSVQNRSTNASIY